MVIGNRNRKGKTKKHVPLCKEKISHVAAYIRKRKKEHTEKRNVHEHTLSMKKWKLGSKGKPDVRGQYEMYRNIFEHVLRSDEVNIKWHYYYYYCYCCLGYCSVFRLVNVIIGRVVV